MSLVELGWRQFTFFEKHDVQDPEKPNERFVGLKNLEACCSTAGDGFTLFGERCGNIFKLTRKLEEYFWIAHKCKLSDFALADNVLATVGEDEEGINSLVKLWQLNRIEKESPFCLRIIRACQQLNASKNVAACSVAIHSSLKHLAVGFTDSSVLYCTGDILKDRSNKWINVVNGETAGELGESTGLALAWLPSQKSCVLFALSSKSVRSYVIANKSVINVVVHDANGCSRDLWSFSETYNRLVVGSTEMVYFYEAEQSLNSDLDGGKGRCHALGRNAEKIQLLTFQEHIGLLTKQVRPSSSALSEIEVTWIVSIYDVEGQCVAFSCALPVVTRIFLLDSVLIVLTQDGNLIALKEKQISKKIEILFKKNLYDLAVGLARRSPIGIEYLPEIHQKYGDYLYKSGDFENAVQQYNETIGFLEPSYVIKKFLDGSHIKELSSYLESLHTKGYGTTKHATILLNCYVKMGSKEKIENFIEKNLDFEVEDAVQALRAANYLKEACHLCEKHKLYDQLFAILIEELQAYDDALSHIKNLDNELVERYLGKYGKLLLEKLPDPTMECLISLIAANDGNSSQIEPAELMKMFIGNSSLCTRFISDVLKMDNRNTRLRLIMLELLLRQWLHHAEGFVNIESEILKLIDDESLEQAVQLCLMFDFAPGIIYAYTKLEKFDELLEFHMRQRNLKEVINLCKKNKNQKLWIDALVFTSRAEAIDPDAIEEANCVHPLLVLEILSHSEVLRVSQVRRYIIEWLKKHDEQALNDEKTIAEDEEKMREIEDQIESLKYNVQVFQQSKCSACDTSLQVPAVHFLCKHSYHLHCLESYSEKADHCPSCARSHNELEYLKKTSGKFNSEDSYKVFQEQVNTSTDCMSLVAFCISKGLFDDWSQNTNTSSGGSDFEKKTQIGKDTFGVQKAQSLLSPFYSSNPFDEEVSNNPFEESLSSVVVEEKTPTNPFDDDF